MTAPIRIPRPPGSTGRPPTTWPGPGPEPDLWYERDVPGPSLVDLGVGYILVPFFVPSGGSEDDR